MESNKLLYARVLAISMINEWLLLARVELFYLLKEVVTRKRDEVVELKIKLSH